MEPAPVIIGVTGHRPPRLGGYTDIVERRLATLAGAVIAELRPAGVITGVAQGWDLAIAEACLSSHILFTAALPFPEPDARWPEAQRERFRRVLSGAAAVETIAAAPARGLYHARDRWIVEHSALIVALWDGEKSGGTYATIRSAEKRRVPVRNVWPRWLELVASAEHGDT